MNTRIRNIAFLVPSIRSGNITKMLDYQHQESTHTYYLLKQNFNRFKICSEPIKKAIIVADVTLTSVSKSVTFTESNDSVDNKAVDDEIEDGGEEETDAAEENEKTLDELIEE